MKKFGISLYSIVETEDDVREYLGISYIKTFLEDNGIPCKAKVIYRDEMDKELLTYDEFPNLIGIALYCNNQHLVSLFCDKIKKICEACQIFLGGPQVMEYEQDILQKMPLVSFVCTGEGEETVYDAVLRLMKGKTLHGCQGITFRENDKIIQNSRRKVVPELNKFSFPYRELNVKNRKRYFYIVGSRGCLGCCTFCAEYITGGADVRVRSPGNIVDEIEYLYKKHGVNKFHFTDPTFEDPGQIGIERAEKIYKEIIQRKLKIRLVMYTRANIVKNMSDMYYELAYEAGVESFFVGIESAVPSELKLYAKKTTAQENLLAIKKIQRHGIYVSFGFICFNPYSTYQSIQENLNFLKASGLVYNSHQVLSRLEIMPQAPIKKKLINDGLLNGFHFDTDLYSYKYVHQEIADFRERIASVLNLEHLIDYDSQIAMDKIYYQKIVPEFFDKYLRKVFDNISECWKIRNEEIYEFMSKALTLHKNNGANMEFADYIKGNKIDFYDKRIKQLFYQYKKIILKELGDI